MQDIGIGAARVTAVSRSEKAPTIFLEFRGVRDAPHTVDKDTRVRVALSLERAAVLRRRLNELVPAASDHLDWQPAVLELLAAHRGETGADEDALEVLQRLSRHWRKDHPAGASS